MVKHLFVPDQRFIEKARAALRDRPNVYWLIGSSCSGKSTIARVLARQSGITVYDMDTEVFGRYRFSAQRHPATTAWFTAANPLAFMLSLSEQEFDSLYRAANAEYLDLWVDDPATTGEQSLLVDGGITHPSLLAQAVPAQQIVCLSAPDDLRHHIWNTDPDRAAMKDSVLALPDGLAMWRRFLAFDAMLATTLVEESLRSGIRVYAHDGQSTPAAVAAVVAGYIGL